MRKQTKIAAVASAAALLAIGASMTAFADEWHQYEDGTWTYWDDEEDPIEGWHTYKSDGKRYYISPEDGKMVTSDIIEVDGDYYYVNSSGARVTDQWVEVSSDKGFGLDEYDGDIEDSYYYYVQKNGKILVGDGTAKKVRLTNKTTDKGLFYFDEWGRMQTGWIKTEDDHYIYCDPEGIDGRVLGQAIQKDWLDLNTVALNDELQKIVDDESMRDDVNNEVWFYFGDDGKNTVGNDVKAADNNRYCFDANGVLARKEWIKADSTTWYYAHSDGKLATNKWEKIGDYYYYFQGRTAFGVNAEQVQTTDKDGKTVYQHKNAKIYTPKYLGGEYYFFDCTGALVAGKIVNTNEGGNCGTLTSSSADLVTRVSGHKYYFDGNGNRVKGAQFTDGDGYTGYVDNNGEVIDDRVAIINGYVYVLNEKRGFSVLLTPEYEDYAYVEVTNAGDIACYKKAGTRDETREVSYKNFLTDTVEKIQIFVKDTGALATSKSNFVAESNRSGAETVIVDSKNKTNAYGVIVVEKVAE